MNWKVVEAKFLWQKVPKQLQSDFLQTDDTKADYIKNKPDLTVYATEEYVDDEAFISSLIFW